MRVYASNKIHYLYLWLFQFSALVNDNDESPWVL